MKYIVLYIFSRIYLSVLLIYNYLYNYNVLRPTQFNVPLISIGNIALGGTGKTPITICISNLLSKKNVKHVIVSRGYKKESKGVVLVSDGISPLSAMIKSAYNSGDEAYLIACKLPSVPVVVGNKIKAVKFAIQKFNPRLILIDDGFQSRYLKIDYNIVLHNCSMENDEMQLFPLGRLRQPVSSLSRANQIILTKQNKPSNNSFLNYENITIHSRSSTSALSWNSNKKVLTKKNNQLENSYPVFVFCGLADPKSFFNSCQKHYNNIAMQKQYLDHIKYENNTSFLNDCSLAQLKKINTFVTSYKDFVKIKNDSQLINLNIVWEIIDIDYVLPENFLQNIPLIKKMI